MSTFTRIFSSSVVPLLAFVALAVGCQPRPTAATDTHAQSLESSLETASRIADSIKCLLPSPQWYKKLWLDLNSEENNLGRAFMTHYMGCSGHTYRLSEAEFRTLPVVLVPMELGPIYLSRDFIDEARANRIGGVGDVIADINDAIVASTHYGNTLGHFQMELRGKLVWRKNALGTIVPRFEGQARIRDRYDFNPSESSANESWRGRDTELRVRMAHIGMPGRPFDIESDWFAYQFDYPKYDSDLIQESALSEKSGYSTYGEQVQVILMTELRSARWEKATHLEKIKIIMNTLRRVHEALPGR